MLKLNVMLRVKNLSFSNRGGFHCILLWIQVLELQSENKRMQLSVREMERELAEARSRIEQLSEELEAATSSAQEQGQESLTRLRRLQNELTSSSKEREAVLKK